MRDPQSDNDDARLGAALRGALAARDLEARPPRFAALWPAAGVARSPAFAWRPAIAAAAAVALIAAVSWTAIRRSGVPDMPALDARIDAALVRELSSPEYWRVPSDELLAFAAPPLSAELPAPMGLQISLEESLL